MTFIAHEHYFQIRNDMFSNLSFSYRNKKLILQNLDALSPGRVQINFKSENEEILEKGSETPWNKKIQMLQATGDVNRLVSSFSIRFIDMDRS